MMYKGGKIDDTCPDIKKYLLRTTTQEQWPFTETLVIRKKKGKMKGGWKVDDGEARTLRTASKEFDPDASRTLFVSGRVGTIADARQVDRARRWRCTLPLVGDTSGRGSPI
jgi:hypothetical protein